VKLRKSELRCDWEDLLSSEAIAAWVSKGATKLLREKLPAEPGVYRWLFACEGSENPRAYIGEGENLRFRISDYLGAAVEPVTSAAEDSFREEELREAIKTIHRCSVVRIGEYLARRAASCNVQLQRLRIVEEGTICGVEISDRLFNDKVGRVLLEHWAILYAERKGYAILNRNPSKQGKDLWDRFERARREAVVEGARLQARRRV